MGRTYKREAVQLREQMKAAGFHISFGADRHIEVFLQRTRHQKAEAIVEVGTENHIDSGILAITQDYMIFAKKSGLQYLFADVFEVSARPNESDVGQSKGAEGICYDIGAVRVRGSSVLRPVNLVALEQINTYLTTGHRPNYSQPKMVPGRNAPPI